MRELLAFDLGFWLYNFVSGTLDPMVEAEALDSSYVRVKDALDIWDVDVPEREVFQQNTSEFVRVIRRKIAVRYPDMDSWVELGRLAAIVVLTAKSPRDAEISAAIQQIAEDVAKRLALPLDALESCMAAAEETPGLPALERFRALITGAKEKRRIFLSHRGSDKPRIRLFWSILSMLGFAPWLDEYDLKGNVERGIHEGITASCAVVFFVTPSFRDDKYLASEIEYAKAMDRRKGKERFAIIALSLKDEAGRRGKVPEFLSDICVIREPENDLDALRLLLRDLPIQPEGMQWKSKAS